MMTILLKIASLIQSERRVTLLKYANKYGV
jgi:hypothetical protein